MSGLPKDGGKKLTHRLVTPLLEDEVSIILEANPARLRVQMFNATGIDSPVVVYVGNYEDVDGNALAATNGYALRAGVDRDPVEKIKEDPNLLILYTKDTVYGVAVGGDGDVKMLEELLA